MCAIPHGRTARHPDITVSRLVSLSAPGASALRAINLIARRAPALAERLDQAIRPGLHTVVHRDSAHAQACGRGAEFLMRELQLPEHDPHVRALRWYEELLSPPRA